MEINFTIYKNSVIASIVDIIGSILIVVSIYLGVEIFFNDNYSNILIIICILSAGFFLKCLASIINEWISNRNLRDIKKNRAFIPQIKDNALEAYRVYLDKPTDEVFEYIKLYNPFAAMRIEDIKSGLITEDEALALIEEYDDIFN